MLRKLIPMIVSLTMMITGCSSYMNADKDKIPYWKDSNNIRIMTATDLHFISPKIMDKGASILKVTEKGDGKVTHYTPEIMDAFIDEVIDAMPDILMITGDLTYNGELASHQDLVEKFRKVKAKGIDVLIIPGNHDIHIPFAYSFEKDKAYYTDSITQEEFNNMYREFGYDSAKIKDPNSFSYVHELSDGSWLLMLDVNTVESSGMMSKETVDWLKGVVKRAQDENRRVFSATHQNLLTHNERFSDSYNVVNADEVRDLLVSVNNVVNFSGHIHVQDISDNPLGFKEIDTGSLAVADNAYGLVEIGKDHLSYRTRTVDVSGYAKKKGINDASLLDFKKYSEDFFRKTSENRMIRRLAENDINVPDEELDKMLEVYTRANLAYFSGRPDTLPESIVSEEGYKLWQKYSADLNIVSYIDRILKNRNNETVLEFDITPVQR